MYASLRNPRLGRSADRILEHFGTRAPYWSKRTVLELMETKSDVAEIHETRYDLIFALPSLLFPVTTEFHPVFTNDHLQGVMLHAPTILAYERIPRTSPLRSTFRGTRALHIAISIPRPVAIVSLAFCLAAITHANNVLDNIISVVDIGYIICDCGAIAILIIDEKHGSAFDEIVSNLPHGEYTSTNEVSGRQFSLAFHPHSANYMTANNFLRALVEVCSALGFE